MNVYYISKHKKLFGGEKGLYLLWNEGGSRGWQSIDSEAGGGGWIKGLVVREEETFIPPFSIVPLDEYILYL